MARLAECAARRSMRNNKSSRSTVNRKLTTSDCVYLWPTLCGNTLFSGSAICLPKSIAFCIFADFLALESLFPICLVFVRSFMPKTENIQINGQKR